MSTSETPVRRASKAEVDERVEMILQLLLQGVRSFEIVQLVTAHPEDGGLGWTLKQRQIFNYLKKARLKIDELTLPKRETALRFSILRLNDLYRKAVSEGRFTAARLIDKDLRELQGLVVARRHEVTGANGGPIEHDILERRRAADAEIETWYQDGDAEAIRAAG